MTFDAEKFIEQYFSDHPKMYVQRESWINDAIQTAYDKGCANGLKSWPCSFRCTCGKLWRHGPAGEHRTGMQAVNAHDGLLTACKELREGMAAAFRVMEYHGFAFEDFEKECAKIHLRDGFGKRAQAAIAKAERKDAP